MSEFKTFDKVLVRNYVTDRWEADLFSRKTEAGYYLTLCGCGKSFCFCIPYEGNESLLGTSSSSEDSPIKFGDHVDVWVDSENRYRHGVVLGEVSQGSYDVAINRDEIVTVKNVIKSNWR